MNICVTIAARGGSKGLPGKNIKQLMGKPLIAYTIEQASACRMIDRVIVSTDSVEIAAVARKFHADVPFLRPKKLAADKTGKLCVLQHAVEYLKEKEGYSPDYVVDLDPTSPLRIVEDIKGCIRLMIKKPCDVVITGSLAKKNPYFNMVEEGKNQKIRLCKTNYQNKPCCRQAAPKVYDMNASIYVYKTASLMKMRSLWDGFVRLYEMPPERSVDIDREIDFKMVEVLMKEMRQ